jgi:hypothetical protein
VHTYEYKLSAHEVILTLRDSEGNSFLQVRKLYYGPNYGPDVDSHTWGASRLTIGEWYMRPLTAGEAMNLKFALVSAVREAERLDELLPPESKAPITNLKGWDIIELGKLV